MAEPKHDAEFAKLIKKLKGRAKDQSFTDLKTVQSMIDRIRKIDGQYTDIKENNLDAFDFYFGKNYMKDIDGRSQVYTGDTAETIEWIMPSLMRVFAGGDDIATLSPRKTEDVSQVEAHNELINYQCKVKNKWFLILNDWFKDSLLLKRGIVKYQWLKDVQKDKKSFNGLTEMELQGALSAPGAVDYKIDKETVVKPEGIAYADDGAGNAVPTVTPAVKVFDATIKYEFEDEFPLVEAVPVEEVGFPVDTRDIETCTFFYHRVKYTQAQFIKRFGKDKFEKVKELKNTFGDSTDDLSVEQQRFEDINGIATKFFYDATEGMWLVYECFYPNDETGDAWKTIFCGSVILEDEENEYKKPPYRILTPIKLAHRVIGMSLFDLLKDLQRIRTSMTRQMLDNVYFNNNGRTLIDPTRVDYNMFLNGNRPGGVCTTLDGNPANEAAVFPIPTPQLAPWFFNAMELIDKEKDYHTGVPRSFQGVNSEALNKTFRGQAQQVDQASQRIEMMARLFAEMGIAPLIRDICDMNARFMSKKQAVKIVDKWIDVTPEDTVVKADVIINVGLGTQSKGQQVQQNQQMIALYLQLFPIFGHALDPHILHAQKELVKAMGYRDYANWVPGEDQAMQGALELEKAKLLDKVSQGGGIGTQPEQPTPEQGAQPTNPMNPQTMIPQGDFFG